MFEKDGKNDGAGCREKEIIFICAADRLFPKKVFT
jgi:hypothetical protein